MDATQKKVLFGCLGCGVLIVLVALASCVGCGVLMFSGPESGVRMGNEMDAYAIKYIEDHHLLQEGEEVVAYYDDTLEMSGKEAVILTDRRVLYHKGGRTDAVALAEITRLRHSDEGLTGDVIVVQAGAKHMKIEIAPLNNGGVFWDTLVGMVKERADGDKVEIVDETGREELDSAAEEAEAYLDQDISEEPAEDSGDNGPPELPPDLAN